MEFEESSLFREVTDILQSGDKPVHYAWRGEIHIGDKTFTPLRIVSIDRVSDYESRYADEIFLLLAIPTGTYAFQIYPHNDNIDITLYRQPLNEVGDVLDEDQPVQSERFTATLIDTGDPILHANGVVSASEDALNLADFVEVYFQLVDKSLEQLRMVMIGGNYRNVTTEDVIKGILNKESAALKLDEKTKVKGVDMVTASNQTVRQHIVIPQGTPLVRLPQYVHESCGGVYSSGMGYYLQNQYWYVYPCFDITRFNSTDKTLTIINVPTARLPSIERTYKTLGDNTTIIATGEVRYLDDSEVQQLNFGNGARFTDASKMIESFVTVKGNKATASRAKNNSEVVTTERANGNNYVRIGKNPINANVFVEYSSLARRQGGIVGLVWENSNPSAIYPGMPIKLFYLKHDEIIELDGVVLKAHHYTHTREPGLIATRYISDTILSVFVKLTETK